MQAINGQNRGCREEEIKLVGKRLLAEAHDRVKKQTDRSRCDALEPCRHPGVITMSMIELADTVHQYRSRQADTQDRHSGSHPAAQFFPNQYRHVRRIQSGQRLADGQHLDKLFVIDPMPLSNEAAAKIGHHAAEAGSTNDQEFEEYVQDGRS